MQAYKEILLQIRDHGAALLAVSPELPERSIETARKQELGFDVLSDVGNHAARRFGLVFSLAATLRPLYEKLGVDLPARNGDPSWELPMPGTFVIGSDGIVHLAFVDADYTHRLEPAEILRCLRELPASSRGRGR